MTSSGLKARNRANAAMSTGPRTVAGKAIVAQNARRHGATAAPDADRVATWLKIIQARPDLEVADVVPDDDRGHAALALAAAEARLAAAQRALRQMEQNPPPLSPFLLAIEADPNHNELELSGFVSTPLERLRSRQLMARIAEHIIEETQPGGRRHRLLKRYLAEARAQRRKAFAVWMLQGGGEKRTGARRPDEPNPETKPVFDVRRRPDRPSR